MRDNFKKISRYEEKHVYLGGLNRLAMCRFSFAVCMCVCMFPLYCSVFLFTVW